MPKDTTKKKNKKGTAEPFVIPPVPNRPQQCNRASPVMIYDYDETQRETLKHTHIFVCL